MGQRSILSRSPPRSCRVDALDAVDIERRMQDHAIHVDLRLDRSADVDIGAEPKCRVPMMFLFRAGCRARTALALTPTEASAGHI